MPLNWNDETIPSEADKTTDTVPRGSKKKLVPKIYPTTFAFDNIRCKCNEIIIYSIILN